MGLVGLVTTAQDAEPGGLPLGDHAFYESSFRQARASVAVAAGVSAVVLAWLRALRKGTSCRWVAWTAVALVSLDLAVAGEGIGDCIRALDEGAVWKGADRAL
jgi:hypothetical protein